MGYHVLFLIHDQHISRMVILRKGHFLSEGFFSGRYMFIPYFWLYRTVTSYCRVVSSYQLLSTIPIHRLMLIQHYVIQWSATKQVLYLYYIIVFLMTIL